MYAIEDKTSVANDKWIAFEARDVKCKCFYNIKSIARLVEKTRRDAKSCINSRVEPATDAIRESSRQLTVVKIFQSHFNKRLKNAIP